MGVDELTAEAQAFLAGVFDRTAGDSTQRVSMFDVGAALGWEREAASHTAQELMGLGMIEIRTLSGAVGLSAEGAAVVRGSRAPVEGSPVAPLGQDRVMTPAECRRATDLCASLRAAAEGGSLPPEIEADLRTIAAQIASPRPKTAIVRECLRSLLESLDPGGSRSYAGIKALLGE
jgi:hypothetical protein